LKLKRHIVPEDAAGCGSARREVANWLEKLGMSEYADRFAENDSVMLTKQRGRKPCGDALSSCFLAVR
jgi:hypothetical protein